MNRFWRDARGTTAVEFALVVPLFIAMLMGALALGMGVWNRNILQQVAMDAARCMALAATSCGTVTAGCAATRAIDCYVARRAGDRGMRTRAIVSVVNPNMKINGVAFTSVSLSYPFRLVGYRIMLSAQAAYPNPT